MVVENINQERLKLIRKGYVNKTELSKFLNVGKNKGIAIYQDIVDSLAKEDKTVDILGIRTCRVLEYIGLTEEDIRRFANDEIMRGSANGN